jgi:hypothetical protein
MLEKLWKERREGSLERSRTGGLSACSSCCDEALF